ncbi:MAG: transcription antitermination factor NusB [Desulfovibrionaceae bacterium]
MDKKLSRSKERELAFQMLYSLEYIEYKEEACLLSAFSAFLEEEYKGSLTEESFSWSLIKGVWEHLKTIDTSISDHAKYWKINRIAKVELSLLRLGTYEIIYTQTPQKVILSEISDLVKRFGDRQTLPFINGVLDAIVKSKDT